MHRRNEFFLASKTGIVVDGAAARGRLQPGQRSPHRSTRASSGSDRPHRPVLHAPLRSQGADRRQRRRDGAGDRGGQDRRLRRLRMERRAHPRSACRPSDGRGAARIFAVDAQRRDSACSTTCKRAGHRAGRLQPDRARRVRRGADAIPRRSRRRTCAPRCRASTRRTGRTTSSWSSELAELAARQRRRRPAQLALRWVLEQGDNCHVIPGTTSIAHLEENYAARRTRYPGRGDCRGAGASSTTTRCAAIAIMTRSGRRSTPRNSRTHDTT